jgi:hypothetical protein
MSQKTNTQRATALEVHLKAWGISVFEVGRTSFTRQLPRIGMLIQYDVVGPAALDVEFT